MRVSWIREIGARLTLILEVLDAFRVIFVRAERDSEVLVGVCPRFVRHLPDLVHQRREHLQRRRDDRILVAVGDQLLGRVVGRVALADQRLDWVRRANRSGGHGVAQTSPYADAKPSPAEARIRSIPHLPTRGVDTSLPE